MDFLILSLPHFWNLPLPLTNSINSKANAPQSGNLTNVHKKVPIFFFGWIIYWSKWTSCSFLSFEFWVCAYILSNEMYTHISRIVKEFKASWFSLESTRFLTIWFPKALLMNRTKLLREISVAREDFQAHTTLRGAPNGLDGLAQAFGCSYRFAIVRLFNGWQTALRWHVLMAHREIN